MQYLLSLKKKRKENKKKEPENEEDNTNDLDETGNKAKIEKDDNKKKNVKKVFILLKKIITKYIFIHFIKYQMMEISIIFGVKIESIYVD